MKTNRDSLVAILGMSDKPDRYSYRAHQKLLANGYENQIGVSPKKMELKNITLVSAPDEIKDKVHTLTLYVGPSRLDSMADAILELAPQRIISNPGTENPLLLERARDAGIEVLEACTLILLDADEF